MICPSKPQRAPSATPVPRPVRLRPGAVRSDGLFKGPAEVRPSPLSWRRRSSSWPRCPSCPNTNQTASRVEREPTLEALAVRRALTQTSTRRARTRCFLPSQQPQSHGTKPRPGPSAQGRIGTGAVSFQQACTSHSRLQRLGSRGGRPLRFGGCSRSRLRYKVARCTPSWAAIRRADKRGFSIRERAISSPARVLSRTRSASNSARP